MSTERELTEAAARAAGKELKFCSNWHPRVNGGDSQNLAAALRISVEHSHPDEKRPWVCASVSTNIGRTQQFMEDVPDESQRADRMRLAILRCAAAQPPANGCAEGSK